MNWELTNSTRNPDVPVNDPVALAVCDNFCGGEIECTITRVSGPTSADFNGYYRLFVQRLLGCEFGEFFD